MAKYAISAFADEAGASLSEQISALKDNGICYIEPRTLDGTNFIKLTDDELFEIKKELDQNGIGISALGSPIGKYPIDEDFEPHFEEFKRACRVCEILGAKRMRIFSFFTGENKLEDVRDEVVRRLNLMLDYADSHNITLCHENEHAIYGQMPKEVFELLSLLPRLHGIYDGANYRLDGADARLGLDATKLHLSYFHVKDSIFEKHLIVPVGEGEGRYEEFLDEIDSFTDDTVYLTLEPHLYISGAYKAVDGRELKGVKHYSSEREAFDTAVLALKKLLIKLNFKENNGIWTR